MDVFSSFYEFAETTMKTVWNAECNSLYAEHHPSVKKALLGYQFKKLTKEPPIVWKTAGDEIIFNLPVTKPVDIWLAIGAFRRFLKAVAHFLREKVAPLKDIVTYSAEQISNADISVKGAAWLASFPEFNLMIPLTRLIGRRVRGRNSTGGSQATGDAEGAVREIVAFAKQPEATAGDLREIIRKRGLTFEYLGPSIDAGFRIAKYAEVKAAAISVELAVVLLELMKEYDKRGEIPIIFERGESLKGLLPGVTKYPKIAILLEAAPGLLPEEALSWREPLRQDDLLISLCDSLMAHKDHGAHFFAVDEVLGRTKGNQEDAGAETGEALIDGLSPLPEETRPDA